MINMNRVIEDKKKKKNKRITEVQIQNTHIMVKHIHYQSGQIFIKLIKKHFTQDGQG